MVFLLASNFVSLLGNDAGMVSLQVRLVSYLSETAQQGLLILAKFRNTKRMTRSVPTGLSDPVASESAEGVGALNKKYASSLGWRASFRAPLLR
jgi:hypothetical protein